MDLEKVMNIYVRTYIHTYVHRSVTSVTITGEAPPIFQCLEPYRMETLVSPCVSHPQSLTHTDIRIRG